MNYRAGEQFVLRDEQGRPTFEGKIVGILKTPEGKEVLAVSDEDILHEKGSLRLFFVEVNEERGRLDIVFGQERIRAYGNLLSKLLQKEG